MNSWIREHNPKEPTPRGWSVVTVPQEGTFLVDKALAIELNALMRRGQLKVARTLLAWFDAPKSDGASS